MAKHPWKLSLSKKYKAFFPSRVIDDQRNL